MMRNLALKLWIDYEIIVWDILQYNMFARIFLYSFGVLLGSTRFLKETRISFIKSIQILFINPWRTWLIYVRKDEGTLRRPKGSLKGSQYLILAGLCGLLFISSPIAKFVHCRNHIQFSVVFCMRKLAFKFDFIKTLSGDFSSYCV